MNDTFKQYLPHLLELRSRITRSLLVIGVVFCVLAYFQHQCFELLAMPILKNIMPNQQLIAIDITAPLLMPLKLAFMLAVFITVPFWLYQSWAFIAPALLKTERRLLNNVLWSSVFLFYAGIAFSYCIVLPLVFNFMASMTPSGVNYLPDISHYLDFCLQCFFAFGIAFEIPIATWLILKLKLISPQRLASYRPYIIVGSFIVGMLLTPPDVISQILLAVPMWLLFELGLALGRR